MSKTILVAGDAIRWVHLTGEARQAAHSPGGLHILKDLIGAWCGDGVQVAISGDSSALPAEYIEWRKFGKAWRPAWRIGSDDWCAGGMSYDPNPTAPDVLVVLDRGRGFANHPDDWPLALREGGSPSQVVLLTNSLPTQWGQTTSAFAQRLGALRDRLTVVVSADLLRARGATISRGLSWDRAIEETAREMTEGLSAGDLTLNKRTIITFGLSGSAVFLAGDMKRFVYDSAHLEGGWEPEWSGLQLLTDLAVTAAVARHESNPEENPLFVALQDALNFAGASQEGLEALTSDSLTGFWQTAAKSALTTPQVSGKHARAFYSAYSHGILSDPAFSNQPATRSDLLRDATGAAMEYVEAKATEVVVFGTRVLDAVPSARFGKFFTVDRDEIEALQTIRRQVESYRANPKIDRPLSIAVFGQPGSGKSFAIKQLAKEILGDQAQVFEFNMTQFQKWEDLVLAFHMIRDASARGRMPFVFWDEFDSAEFRWLKHFLAPMQDAEFHSAGHAFAFGRGIFVFAGGVAHTMAEFHNRVANETAKKGPDFISRLHGYLNVKGPNPAPVSEIGHDAPEAKPEQDPAHLIRRAIMLRIAIERFQTQILDASGTAAISPGVVRAFLRVRKFEHGARSLEALVSQSRASSSLEASDLPPAAVVRLHVDESFDEQAKLGLLRVPVIEALAKACHDAWWVQKRERFAMNPNSDAAKAHDRLKDYATAPRRYVDSSRKTARVTEAKLAVLGFRIARNGDGEPATLSEPEIKHLMDIEHDIWLRDYLQQGYERSAETRDILRQHNCIRRFSELSEADKSLDLAIARSIEPTLSESGYQLVSVAV